MSKNSVTTLQPGDVYCDRDMGRIVYIDSSCSSLCLSVCLKYCRKTKTMTVSQIRGQQLIKPTKLMKVCFPAPPIHFSQRHAHQINLEEIIAQSSRF